MDLKSQTWNHNDLNPFFWEAAGLTSLCIRLLNFAPAFPADAQQNIIKLLQVLVERFEEKLFDNWSPIDKKGKGWDIFLDKVIDVILI